MHQYCEFDGLFRLRVACPTGGRVFDALQAEVAICEGALNV